MTTQVHTVCRLCSACCPVIAEVENGRLVRAERKSFLPAEKRLICPKLRAAPDIVYAPDRILKPLVRKERGGRWQEASWDAALDLVAGRMLKYKEQFGAESVAWLRGMAADWGAPWDYANRVMNLFGSPNTIGNGSVCHVAREMAHVYTYGSLTLAQPRNSRCIVVWGKNDRHTAPGTCEAILAAKEEGAKLIVIDPVQTSLAKMADLWLQIKPGHDGLLALAMMQEIIAQGLYDENFVERYCLGFEELKKTAAAYPAEVVGPQIWLTPEEIREAARLYATTKPACIIDGNGLDMHLEVFQTTRAVCCLRALTGNLDKPGGDFILQPVPTHDLQAREHLSASTVPITRDYPLFNAFHHNWGLHVQSALVDAILEERPYPIQMVVVQSGNPVVTMADANRAQRAFEKLACLVVIDLFLNRTSQWAEVFLPACSCFEKTQLNRAYLRNSPVILANEVIPPLGESRPDWWIMFELGRRLGLAEYFPWQTVEEAIDYQLQPAGLTVAQLRQHPDGLRAGPLQFEKYRLRGFATPSGKVELFSVRLAAAGQPPIPFQHGVSAAIGFAGEAGPDHLIGISGARLNRFTHTQFFNIPALRRGDPEPTADLHPEEARRRGIESGQLLTITTPRGQVTMRARLTHVVPPGVVRLAWGWGEVDPSLNVNNLTDDDQRDPVTGTPASRSFYCRLES